MKKVIFTDMTILSRRNGACLHLCTKLKQSVVDAKTELSFQINVTRRGNGEEGKRNMKMGRLMTENLDEGNSQML